MLKRWFDRSERQYAFALWVADRATLRKGKTAGEVVQLFREARRLLKKPVPVRHEVDRTATQRLYERLRVFQYEYRRDRWGDIRIVHNWNSLLVEKGLAIYLDPRPEAAACYKLAADYRQHCARVWQLPNGPSSTKSWSWSASCLPTRC